MYVPGLRPRALVGGHLGKAKSAMNPEQAQRARMIGQRLKQIRLARGKGLVVVAGLAGMSKSKLDMIERGESALDKLSDIVALAGALEVSPSDLVRLPVPAPANGH